MAGTRAAGRGRGAAKRGKAPARAQGGPSQDVLPDNLPAPEDITADRASSVAAEELLATALHRRTPRPSQKQAAINDNKKASMAKELEDLKKKYRKLKEHSQQLDIDNVTGDYNEEGAGGQLSDAFESEEEDGDVVQQRQHQSEFTSRGIIHTSSTAQPPAKRLRRDGDSVTPAPAQTAPARISTGDNTSPPADSTAPVTTTPVQLNTGSTAAPCIHVGTTAEPATPASESSTTVMSHPRNGSIVSRTPLRQASPNGCWPSPSTDAPSPSPQPSHDELHVSGTALSTPPSQFATPTLALAPVLAVTLQPERPPVDAPYKHGQVPTGKPKAADYDPRVDKLIIHACHQYEVLLSTEEPFPEAGSPVMWASRVWADVCRSAEVNYTLSDRIEKIIIGRTSHGRGGLRDKIRPLISGTYGFLLDGSERSKVANLARYNFLLDRDALKPEPRFHYEDVEIKRRFAHNRIITTVIKEQWFADAGGPGVKYAAQFSPIRDVTLALIFTAIEYCLDQWVSGHYDKNLTFSEKVYRAKYERHLLHIREWCKINPEATRSIRQRMYDRARRASGAAPEARLLIGLSSSSRDRLRDELSAYNASAWGSDEDGQA